MKGTLLILTFFIIPAAFSQTGKTDSAIHLSEVIVKAYGQNKQLKKTSAAINYIGYTQLERSNNSNILPALNNTPGVRMEERSPGSYRMNIRGSTLRSPFGIRNVKVYRDEIPLTDPGGNTYLNQLNYYNFHAIEVIKGPGGSLYGAGTGGVILVQTQPQDWQRGFDVNLLGGSYGLLNTHIRLKAGKEKLQNVLSYSHQSSDGYRDHTRMYRDVADWQVKIIGGKKEQLKFSVLYGDLYYQTPGALTKAEWTSNPRAARPRAGAFPSADSAKAAIFQESILTGLTNEFKFSEKFRNTLVIYGAFTELKNPTFRNYEKRTEPHFGGRTFFTWDRTIHSALLQIIFGAEAQKGWFNTKTYTNKYGKPDVLLTNDNIRPVIYSFFTQADLSLKQDWNVTLGVSTNQASMEIHRISEPNFTTVKRKFNNEFAPRLAISKRMIENLWLYASIAKGFSPPTVAEVLPSTSVISTDLQAEHGINYEAGIKSSWFQQRLYLEINAFYYRLQNAIVQRKDASNADYFTNAGSTKQRGIESQLSWLLASNNNSIISSARLWISHTWNKFNYDEFKQSTNDYSGNQLPSVSPQTIAAGFDMTVKNGLYANASYFYSDRIALNDGNTEFASSYNLLGARSGYRKLLKKKFMVDAFAGVENLFDITYSLGNDINAAGGRYYNAAPGRNLYGGISFHF